MSSSEEEREQDWENPEEQPLVIAGKSFTELLEDKLLEEGEVVSITTTKSQPVPEHVVSGDVGVRRPFLRRGMGLTRFNLPPDPGQQPSRVRRSHSQPKLSEVRAWETLPTC